MTNAPFRIDVITLTPDIWPMLASQATGLVGRAFRDGLAECRVEHLRDYGKGVHRQVDDTPFGGGPGMLIGPEPTLHAINTVRKRNPGPVIMLSPRGKVFNQAIANELAQGEGMTFLCGRYEGFDERVRAYVDLDLSIGDFVLSGGDPAAWCMVDAIVRRLPSVLGNADSIVDESFENRGLEHPQFTRPAEFDGRRVPDVLRSGDHAKIDNWRREVGDQLTRKYRPDLKQEVETTGLKDLDGRLWRDDLDHAK